MHGSEIIQQDINSFMHVIVLLLTSIFEKDYTYCINVKVSAILGLILAVNRYFYWLELQPRPLKFQHTCSTQITIGQLKNMKMRAWSLNLIETMYGCCITVDCLVCLICFTLFSTCTQRRALGRLWWAQMEVLAASCDQTGASLSDVAHLLNTQVFCSPVLLVIDSIHVMPDRHLYM